MNTLLSYLSSERPTEPRLANGNGPEEGVGIWNSILFTVG